MRNLVVIPSDLISDYEAKGTSSWLRDYYNPTGYFDNVYVLSPIEKVKQEKYGLIIIPVSSGKHYKKILKKINPICVRAYGGYWATDYAVYNKVKGIPVVSSVHDTKEELIHSSLEFSDFIISMSSVIKNILLNKKYATKNTVEILGNRVNTSNFKLKDKKEIEISGIREKFPEGKMILHIGRKVYQKNIENVIESLKYLPNEYFLVQIGIGDFDIYKKKAEESNVGNRVFEIQSISNTELPLWYNAADVICIPSRWEGFGVVFIEAAICMSKIVTSNIAPMNEFLINDSEMNYLVDDYENSKKISENIILACENDKYNDNTSEIVKNKFEKSIVDKNEAKIYSKIESIETSFGVAFYKWKLLFFFKKYFIPKLKKLPKRIWRKLLSYL